MASTMRETGSSIILTLRRHGGAEIEIAWDAILRITAARQDLFNPQIVVIEIHAASAAWEVDAADCGGFEAFSHLLGRRLPGVLPYATWWPIVTEPLGRQEDVLLYRRSQP